VTSIKLKLKLVKKNLAVAKRQRTIILKAFRSLGDKPGGRTLDSLNDYIARLEKSKSFLTKKVSRRKK